MDSSRSKISDHKLKNTIVKGVPLRWKRKDNEDYITEVYIYSGARITKHLKALHNNNNRREIPISTKISKALKSLIISKVDLHHPNPTFFTESY